MSTVTGKRKAPAETVATTDDVEDDGGEITEAAKKAETPEQRERRERKNQRARERRAAKKAMADISAAAAEPAEVKAEKAAAKQKKKEAMAEGDKLCVMPTEEEIMGTDHVTAKATEAASKAAEKHPQFGVGSNWFDKSVLDAGLLFCNNLLENAKKIVEEKKREDASSADVLFNSRVRLKEYITGSANTREHLRRTFSHGHFTCDDVGRLCTWLMREFAGDDRILNLGLNKIESVDFVSGVLLQPTMVEMMMRRAACSADDALLFLQQEIRDDVLMERFEADSRQRLEKRARVKLGVDGK